MRDIKTVVFLSANRTGSGKTYLRKCAELGYSTILFLDPSEEVDIPEDYSVQVERVALSDAESVLAAIAQFRDREIVGVLSSSEYYQELVAEVAQRLGLPSNAPACVRACRDKSSQRELLAQAGIPQPRYRRVYSINEAVAAFHEFKCPVVVKPVDETGSVGVRLARTGEEVTEATASILARHSNVRGMPTCAWALIEEYIDAPEFSVEIFQGKALGITKKYLGPTPTFLEIGHVFPAPVSLEEADALETAAESAVAALGLAFGPIHVELKLAAGNQPVIIEINPRLAGGSIPRLLELTGIDLIGESIRASARGAETHTRQKSGAAAIWFIRPASSGVLRGTQGEEDASVTPGVEEVSLYFPKNHQVTLRGDFRDRIGHVITRVPSPLDALNLAKSVCESISITIG